MRVLAGPEAIDQAARMRRTIEGGLDAQLADLETTAGRLSDPDIWDGPHARRFRDHWHEMGPRLRAAQADVAALRDWADTVTGSIISAGGGAPG